MILAVFFAVFLLACWGTAVAIQIERHLDQIEAKLDKLRRDLNPDGCPGRR